MKKTKKKLVESFRKFINFYPIIRIKIDRISFKALFVSSHYFFFPLFVFMVIRFNNFENGVYRFYARLNFLNFQISKFETKFKIYPNFFVKLFAALFSNKPLWCFSLQRIFFVGRFSYFQIPLILLMAEEEEPDAKKGEDSEAPGEAEQQGPPSPPEGPQFDLNEILQTISSSVRNANQNLARLLNNPASSPSQSFAKKVVLEESEVSPEIMAKYPGILAQNKRVNLTRKTLLKITLSYTNDIFLTKSASDKPVPAKLTFIVIPNGDWQGSVVDLLESVRGSIYQKLRCCLNSGVFFRAIRIQVYRLSKTVQDLEPIDSSIISGTPFLDVQSGFVGRGKMDLPNRKLTAAEVASLRQTLDFSMTLLVGEEGNIRDTNRVAIVGHPYLNPLSIFVSEKERMNSPIALIEGSAKPEILELCLLLSTSMQCNGVPLKFYESYRGGKKFLPVIAMVVTGLRFTSGKSSLDPGMFEEPDV